MLTRWRFSPDVLEWSFYWLTAAMLWAVVALLFVG
jgi:hypothetical protein